MAGFLRGLFKKRDKFSLENLRHLHHQLVRNPQITSRNEKLIVETLRSIAELMIWGDQHSDEFFFFFAEKDLIQYILKILGQRCDRKVKIQILQTLSIMVQNISKDMSMYYLLSNNRINDLIVHKFDFGDEELLEYFVSFLKALSLKLSLKMLPFFFNAAANDFPLYTEAIQFFRHPEPMVRIAVRTLTLNVYRVDDPDLRAFIMDRSAVPYFFNLTWFIRDRTLDVDAAIRAGKGRRLASLLAEQEDHFFYLQDILELGVHGLDHVLTDQLLSLFALPLLFSGLPTPLPGDLEPAEGDSKTSVAESCETGDSGASPAPAESSSELAAPPAAGAGAEGGFPHPLMAEFDPPEEQNPKLHPKLCLLFLGQLFSIFHHPGFVNSVFYALLGRRPPRLVKHLVTSPPNAAVLPSVPLTHLLWPAIRHERVHGLSSGTGGGASTAPGTAGPASSGGSGCSGSSASEDDGDAADPSAPGAAEAAAKKRERRNRRKQRASLPVDQNMRARSRVQQVATAELDVSIPSNAAPMESNPWREALLALASTAHEAADESAAAAAAALATSASDDGTPLEPTSPVAAQGASSAAPESSEATAESRRASAIRQSIAIEDDADDPRPLRDYAILVIRSLLMNPVVDQKLLNKLRQHPAFAREQAYLDDLESSDRAHAVRKLEIRLREIVPCEPLGQTTHLQQQQQQLPGVLAAAPAAVVSPAVAPAPVAAAPPAIPADDSSEASPAPLLDLEPAAPVASDDERPSGAEPEVPAAMEAAPVSETPVPAAVGQPASPASSVPEVEDPTAEPPAADPQPSENGVQPSAVAPAGLDDAAEVDKIEAVSTSPQDDVVSVDVGTRSSDAVDASADLPPTDGATEEKAPVVAVAVPSIAVENGNGESTGVLLDRESPRVEAQDSGEKAPPVADLSSAPVPADE